MTHRQPIYWTLDQVADAVIGPLLGQALSLVKTYDQQVSAANVALKKVTP